MADLCAAANNTSPSDDEFECKGSVELLRVLIVEDTEPVSTLFALALQNEGMTTAVTHAYEGVELLRESFVPHIILLNLDLHEGSGFETLSQIVRGGGCGVIVTTINNTKHTRLDALEHGADDYMVKPVPMRELAARIRAVRRRMKRPVQRTRSQSRPVLDPDHRMLRGPGDAVTPLTEAEFATLEALIDACGSPLTREWIGRVALGRRISPEDRSIDQMMMKIRRKLAQHGITRRTILCSRNVGYVIVEPNCFDFVGRQQSALPHAAP